VPRYAALDVGSNSIRLLVADVDERGRTTRLVSDRQVVRLGTGVFIDGRLCSSSVDLAYRVLERMAGEYHSWQVDAVRAVGTSALRDASNRDPFLARAASILGTPVEVIDGLEEARLVQLGVSARCPHPDQPLLIVDIGGGSAQLILSDGGRFVTAFSEPLGAVRLTESFLKDDPPNRRDLARLREHIRERVSGALDAFRQAGVQRVIATSSTAAAVVCAANEIKRARRDEADGMAATTPQVRELFISFAERSTKDRAKITGVGPRRAEIIVAGTAVLIEILGGVGVPHLS
jgi:exopolyphosphatase/guanosine-5'-triphosphate,3'-diphosphate pyrophosphatase